jgi:hypothetical protein
VSDEKSHPVLDTIAAAVRDHPHYRHVSRYSESVEFWDAEKGRWYEAVVREIDRDDDDADNGPVKGCDGRETANG